METTLLNKIETAKKLHYKKNRTYLEEQLLFDYVNYVCSFYFKKNVELIDDLSDKDLKKQLKKYRQDVVSSLHIPYDIIKENYLYSE